MKKIFYVLFLSLILGNKSSGQEQKSFQVFGFVQPVFNINFDNVIPNNQFYLNRVRVGIKNRLTKTIRGEIELDPLDKLIIKDVKIEFRIFRDFELSLGRFKKPFSLERLKPVKDLPFLERSKIVKEIDDLSYAGRDIGIQISYHTKVNKIEMSLIAGIFNGNPYSATEDNNNSKSYAQRIEFSLKENFSLGLNSSQRFDSLSRNYFIANGLDFSFQPIRALNFTSEFLFGKKNSSTSIGGLYSTIEYELQKFTFGFRYSKYYKDISKYSSNFYEAKIDWKLEKSVRIQLNFINESTNSKNYSNLFLGISYEF